MKGQVKRKEISYEVGFSRPAFSQMNSFLEISEAIYDDMSPHILIPPSAIRFKSGSSIDDASIGITLPMSSFTMEAKLTGYKARFYVPDQSFGMEFAKRLINQFDRTAENFLSNGKPEVWRIQRQFWIDLENGDQDIKEILGKFIVNPNEQDPFKFGSSETDFVVNLTSFNEDRSWSINVCFEKSILKGTDLFIGVAIEYSPDGHSQCDSFEKKIDHVSDVVKKVFSQTRININ